MAFLMTYNMSTLYFNIWNKALYFRILKNKKPLLRSKLLKKSIKLHKVSNIYTKMASLIEILSLRILYYLMVLENYVILDGQLSVMAEEKPTVVPLIMSRHRFYKESSMMRQLISGA